MASQCSIFFLKPHKLYPFLSCRDSTSCYNWPPKGSTRVSICLSKISTGDLTGLWAWLEILLRAVLESLLLLTKVTHGHTDFMWLPCSLIYVHVQVSVIKDCNDALYILYLVCAVHSVDWTKKYIKAVPHFLVPRWRAATAVSLDS